MLIEQLLRKEYIERGMAPKKVIINGELLIVPYVYVEKGKSFADDFWDVNEQNIQEYKKAGKIPKKIIYKGRSYVIPLKDSNKKLTHSEIVQKVTKQAIDKYKKSIILAMMLRKAKNDPKIPFYIDKSMFTCRKRMLISKLKMEQVNFDIYRVKEFFDKGVRFVHSHNWELGLKRVKKATLTVFTTSLIGGTVALSDKMFENGTENDEKQVEKQFLEKNLLVEDQEHQVDYLEIEEKQDEAILRLPEDDGKMNFVAKCAGKYNDKYGNLAMLDTVYDDISVLLVMFEDYRSTAYDDGNGNISIGWGNTSYLDKYGRSMGKVKANDKITMEEALTQRDLYLYYVVVPKLAKINHKMTAEEVAAFASVAWWMGPGIIEKSEFYRKLKQNDKTCWNSLLNCSSIVSIQKRMGATRDFATGKITSQDLIKLPSGWIYNLNISKYRNGQSAEEIKEAANESLSYKLQSKLPSFVIANMQNEKLQMQIAQNRNVSRV